MSARSFPHQNVSITCCEKSLSLSGCKPFSGKASEKSKSTKKGESTVEPTFEMILPNKLSFDKDLYSRTLSTTREREKLAGNYASVIQIAHLPTVRKDCMWGDGIGVHAPDSCERVTFEKFDHSYIYTYPFTHPWYHTEEYRKALSHPSQ